MDERNPRLIGVYAGNGCFSSVFGIALLCKSIGSRSKIPLVFKNGIGMKFRIPVSNFKERRGRKRVEEVPALVIGRGTGAEILAWTTPVPCTTTYMYQGPSMWFEDFLPTDSLVVEISRAVSHALVFVQAQ